MRCKLIPPPASASEAPRSAVRAHNVAFTNAPGLPAAKKLAISKGTGGG
jgi:hypothetical protein